MILVRRFTRWSCSVSRPHATSPWRSFSPTSLLARRGARTTHLIAEMPYQSFDTPANAVRKRAAVRRNRPRTPVKIECRVIDEVRRVRDAGGIEVIGPRREVLPRRPTASSRGVTRTKRNGYSMTRSRCRKPDATRLCWKFTTSLARKIHRQLSIPTIGIGAGPYTDGQVLVIHDVLGMFESFLPPFAKRFAELAPAARAGCAAYVADVRAGRFPDAAHSRE